jgi:hypothetical protein
MTKGAIRKGNPFKPSALEDKILKGMVSKHSAHREGNKFYASGAAFCPRQAVKFLVTKKSDKITPASRAYMDIGIAIHEMITDALFKTNNLLFKEFRLPPHENPDIRGLVDAVYFGPDDQIRGGEFKSCGNLPGRPREGHELQALVYGAMTGLEMTILYLSRKVAGYDGVLMMKSFDIECDEGSLHRALSRVCVGHYAHEARLLPEMSPAFKRDDDCRFCVFQSECWDGDEEDLPTASLEVMNGIVAEAEDRAWEILEERHVRKTGILKHIQRNTSPEIARKMESISWD